MLALILLILGIGLAGSGAWGDRSTDLSEVREFDAFKLYYAGPEAAGFPLSDVVANDYEGRPEIAARPTFLYGDCTPPRFGEGGCPLPVDVQNWSICRRSPDMYTDRAPRLFDFRGAKATWGGGATLEIYTGRTTVAIFTRRKLAMSVARQLRTVDQEQPGRLPPPVEGSLRGVADCEV